MTREEIIEMAKQAGFVTNEIKSYVISPYTSEDQDLYQELEAFAKLVAEKAIKEALAQQAAVEHDLAAAYRTELDKLSQRNYELRMENAQLKAQPKEPEQEPIAYFNPQVKGGFYWAKTTKITAPITVRVEPMPLYTSPPQRTFVQELKVSAAYRTLERLGYTFNGGEEWKPPLGKLKEIK